MQNYSIYPVECGIKLRFGIMDKSDKMRQTVNISNYSQILMRLAHVRFKETDFDVPMSDKLFISDLKNAISATTDVPPFRQVLVCDGRTLEDTESLSISNIPETSVILVHEIPETFKVQVRGRAFSPFLLTISLSETVSNVKHRIEKERKIAHETQTLVAKGKVLQDDLSLAFYNIRPNTPLFVKIQEKTESAKLAHLIDRLFELMSDFLTANDSRRVEVSIEITKIIENPHLIAYAKIHPRTARLIDESRFMIEEFQYMTSDKLSRVILDLQDLAITQYESSPDGIRVLQELMEDMEKSDVRLETNIPTNLNYKPVISSTKLPACWGPFCRDDATEKEFAQQISVLKKMGFTDEKVMLKALTETAGNIPQAAKIIFNRFAHE